MWILVSEGDQKASSDMNAAMPNLEAAGAKISRAIWNARAGQAEAETNVRKMIEDGNNIQYTLFKDGFTPYYFDVHAIGGMYIKVTFSMKILHCISSRNPRISRVS
ncbi:MAG: hypothetical protein H6Q72_3767 [Firmicutes bacterium]|nr:hypothetical protein [Bacillota bacterium]